MSKHHYSPDELDDAANADLLADAKQAERQAVEGPFYPDKGITRESLLAYAKRCRDQIGPMAHKRVVEGKS